MVVSWWITCDIIGLLMQQQLLPSIIYRDLIKRGMAGPKQWTPEEDKILRELFEVRKVPKWSTIAQLMASEYKMYGRNGKQCRERYQTALAPDFKVQEWTAQEEQKMYALHDELGNKWAQIAQRMQDRTDNCVKNHFYSSLRKAIRKLNKCISDNFKGEIRQIRPIVLYKIIEATDNHFSLTPAARQDTILACRDIKNKLLQFGSNNCKLEANLEQIKSLANEIHLFSRDYKRKPKKDRRGVAQSLNLMKVPKIDKYKCASDVEDDNNCSSISISVSERDSIHMGDNQQPEEAKLVMHKITSVIEIGKSGHRVNRNEEGKGVEAFLKNAGILQDSEINQHPLFNQSLSDSGPLDLREKNVQIYLGESMEQFKPSLNFKLSGQLEGEPNIFRST